MIFLKTFLMSRDMYCRTCGNSRSQTCLGYHLIDQGPCLINQMIDSNHGTVIANINMHVSQSHVVHVYGHNYRSTI